tara:strand:- start:77 stop:769 length:693 start_codon:yes stop_codon:yes gene_type:complete
MGWKNILKREVDTSTFTYYVTEDNYTLNDKFGDAVREKINDASLLDMMNESDLLYSEMLRITRDDLNEIFDIRPYLKDLYNKLSREFTKEEIADTMNAFRNSPRNSIDKTEEIDEYIVNFMHEKAKPFVRKALQPQTKSMIFIGSLPKDAKSKEEAIKKLNNYAAELDIGYYPKLNENATLEQFKKSLGEMEAYIHGAASSFNGYMDNGLGWYHILREIEGFRTLDKLWN